MSSIPPPLVLFGAFDRHNFGDLLFAHIAAGGAGAGRSLEFAGLAERDLRRVGGHQTISLRALVERYDGSPVNVLHVGGEILTCSAREAAVMLQQQPALGPGNVRPVPSADQPEVTLGVADWAPYVLPHAASGGARRIAYTGVGGVGLHGCEQAMREEVFEKLRRADHLTVRERRTQSQLAANGISSMLVPDPAVMVAEYFGPEISRYGASGELKQLKSVFPQAYLAVQFSADFGNDGILDEIAAQLDRLVAVSGYGVVLFRAGAAPWHDDVAAYESVLARMRGGSVRIFTGLHLWEICTLIAGSRGYCGSSLHGRIVAMAYALPRINLLHPAQPHGFSKQAAYAETWEMDNMPDAVGIGELAAAMEHALGFDRPILSHHAAMLVDQYKLEMESLRRLFND